MATNSGLRRILLVRHAECEMNLRLGAEVGGRSNESPLTAKGREQAVSLGKWMAKQSRISRVSRIYTSTAVRTRDTAKLMLEHMQLDQVEVSAHEELLELSQGEWEGKPRDECYTREVFRAIDADPWNFAAPQGESQKQVEDRVLQFINSEVLPNTVPGGEPTVMVTHGLVIKCLLRGLLDSKPAMTWKIALDNTSLTEIAFVDEGGAKGWHIIQVNGTSHILA